jgi:hypothetical protein
MKGPVYLIGSLRNPEVPVVAEQIRALGLEVFDDWYAAGPEADDYWKKYEQARGRTYREALYGYAARHVFSFDLKHLNRCNIGVLLLPAGKSGHLELGYMRGQGKDCYIWTPPNETERWDVMYQFARVVHNVEEFASCL